MTVVPPLSDLTAFATLARHCSFSRAADELGVSRSALSHTVRVLEERLEMRLFHRTTRSVSLTEQGAELLARVKPVMGDLETIFDDLAERQGGPSGLLRINASESVVRLLMQHVVPTFLQRHPRMQLDLSSEGRFVDIVAQGFDAGVRFRDAVPLDMIAVPFGGPERFVAVASPDYLATHPAPVEPAALAHHRCIRHRMPSGAAYSWEFETEDERLSIDVPGVLTLDHVGLMVEAAASGMGIAYVPEIAARAALGNGQLELVLEQWCPAGPGLCLYYPGRRHLPAGLRGFIDVLRETLPNG
ncbi:transcriptional regulator [Allosediminivita pacifica]|uniref:DNA-binding transcriptional LysR family regulator n=1 Tax=Allosediminivita pacifica TaxID=1267769 RepID=A0A2T6B5Y4_9RHOB|nr:DNA-binding transcriptional LysR family regulator [Allosediminivita pacifica]GGB00047.1 transcriptional regulator [Allosediminivita pacifica]